MSTFEKDSLGTRMKENYERRQRFFMTRRTPVIVRVDGKAFHSYTKGFNRPFDQKIIDAMVGSAIALAYEMQGFKLGYIQSDEASFLLTDYDTLQTDAWFDYSQSKVESISSSVMTANFNDLIYWSLERDLEEGDVPSDKDAEIMGLQNKMAFFDARAWNQPREEVANYFLWRAKDWERNSLSMYCREFFSAKDMHGKNRQEQHEMLYGIGKNWTNDLNDQLKNGTYIVKDANGNIEKSFVPPDFAVIDAMVAPLIIPKEQ